MKFFTKTGAFACFFLGLFTFALSFAFLLKTPPSLINAIIIVVLLGISVWLFWQWHEVIS
jgi:hypothetical protein